MKIQAHNASRVCVGGSDETSFNSKPLSQANTSGPNDNGLLPLTQTGGGTAPLKKSNEALMVLECVCNRNRLCRHLPGVAINTTCRCLELSTAARALISRMIPFGHVGLLYACFAKPSKRRPVIVTCLRFRASQVAAVSSKALNANHGSCVFS